MLWPLVQYIKQRDPREIAHEVMLDVLGYNTFSMTAAGVSRPEDIEVAVARELESAIARERARIERQREETWGPLKMVYAIASAVISIAVSVVATPAVGAAVGAALGVVASAINFAEEATATSTIDVTLGQKDIFGRDDAVSVQGGRVVGRIERYPISPQNIPEKVLDVRRVMWERIRENSLFRILAPATSASGNNAPYPRGLEFLTATLPSNFVPKSLRTTPTTRFPVVVAILMRVDTLSEMTELSRPGHLKVTGPTGTAVGLYLLGPNGAPNAVPAAAVILDSSGQVEAPVPEGAYFLRVRLPDGHDNARRINVPALGLIVSGFTFGMERPVPATGVLTVTGPQGWGTALYDERATGESKPLAMAIIDANCIVAAPVPAGVYQLRVRTPMGRDASMRITVPSEGLTMRAEDVFGPAPLVAARLRITGVAGWLAGVYYETANVETDIPRIAFPIDASGRNDVMMPPDRYKIRIHTDSGEDRVQSINLTANGLVVSAQDVIAGIVRPVEIVRSTSDGAKTKPANTIWWVVGVAAAVTIAAATLMRGDVRSNPSPRRPSRKYRHD
jgi:hypothetical protein